MATDLMETLPMDIEALESSAYFRANSFCDDVVALSDDDDKPACKASAAAVSSEDW